MLPACPWLSAKMHLQWPWLYVPSLLLSLIKFLHLHGRTNVFFTPGIPAELCVLQTSAMQCAGVSQAVQKWRKYPNPPMLPSFWSLLLETTALLFHWLYSYKKLHALEQRMNSSKRCFTCQCSPSSCYRQYSCLIIIHECSTEPFFLFPQMLGKWLLSPEVKGCLCRNKNPHYYLDGHYSQLFISFL